MSEQLSPKAIIAESIIENFEAVSSYVARQSLRDMLDENQTLRAENARLKECLRECVSCIEVLSMRGVDHDECGTVESAIREGWWCNMAIDARTHALVALQPERGKP